MDKVDNNTLNLLDEITQVVDNPTLRDSATGRFLPGNKLAAGPGLSPGKRIAHLVRRKLEEADSSGGKPAVERVIDNAVSIATNPDARYSKEAIWAYRALFEYAYGVPMKSEEELDAMRQGGVQIAIISVPGQPTQITASQPKKLLVPEFDSE